MIQNKYFYHSECYKSGANKTDLNISKLKYEKSLLLEKELLSGESDVLISSPVSCDIISPNTTLGERKTLISAITPFDKTLCIICQTRCGKLHKVEYKNTGERMLDVAKQLENPSFLLSMNTVPNTADVVENDVQYHLTCWVLASIALVSLFKISMGI